MKLVYLGSGRFGIESLEALRRSNHDIDLLVTQPPRPAGRGRKPCPTPVAQWASQRTGRAELIQAENVNDPGIVEKIAACQPEVIVVIAFGQKIGPALTSLPTKAAINVHASLLPKYRGAAPINWAIINGETHTGISIITVSQEMDAGQILAQSQTGIKPDETAGELHDRLACLAAPLLIETLDRIADGTAVYTDQDHSQATLAPRLKKSDGLLDFNEPAEVLARKIRGLWPWPGASAGYISKKTGATTRVTIAMARVTQRTGTGSPPPGTLDENLHVVCGRDALEIIRIKPAGSPVMSFKAFVNGRQTQPGEKFIRLEK